MNRLVKTWRRHGKTMVKTSYERCHGTVEAAFFIPNMSSSLTAEPPMALVVVVLVVVVAVVAM